jgi:hypothetical protein
VTSPNSGTVTIQETSVTGTPPTGFGFIGQQVNITAPDASVADPLILVFEIASSSLPAGGVTNVQIFKNGVLVADCTGAPQAIPDPCVESRSTLPSGNGVITVLTSSASAWNFGQATGPTHTPKPTHKPFFVPVITPSGHCIYLPFFSDIVRHPNRHPGWTVLSGKTCPPPTPTPTPTPKPQHCHDHHAWFSWFHFHRECHDRD